MDDLDSKIQQAIADALEHGKETLISDMKANGKYVSGKTASTLRVADNKLFGAAYFDVMLDGRAGGGVPANFRDILLRWASQKGITFASKSDANRWAYFTAKKIKESGTLQYRRGQHIDLYSNMIDTITKDINESLPEVVEGLIGAEIQLNYKKK